MSLWTCIACTARRAVGMLECPQCGAAEHEEGDTVSGSEGVQGQPHIPAAYTDTVPAATPVQPAVVAAAPVVPEQRTPPADTTPPDPASPQ